MRIDDCHLVLGHIARIGLEFHIAASFASSRHRFIRGGIDVTTAYFRRYASYWEYVLYKMRKLWTKAKKH
jgi:hypothetical protein